MPIPERSLTDDQRRELEAAHRKLREAVAGYERFLGGDLASNAPIVVHNAELVADAQRAIEEAERELWKLREQYLGWPRPSWAPSAAFEADWFSDEDKAYDEVSTGPTR